jgi:DNA-binding HxlR family transcriptional regulator
MGCKIRHNTCLLQLDWLASRSVKSYQQYCSVARALDLVGDRWVLLIVRELLAFGPSRYIDLKRGLPAIASNVLVDRLKTMEAGGLIERRDAPAPIGTGVYQLTARGRELDDVLRALSRWGQPEMPSGPSEEDAVQPQWSALFAGLILGEHVPPDVEIVIGVETGDEAVRVTLRHDAFQVERGPGGDVDVTLAGPALLVGGVLSGLLTVAEATQLGLTVSGQTDLLVSLVNARADQDRRDNDQAQTGAAR